MANLAGKDYLTIAEAAAYCCVSELLFVEKAKATDLPIGKLWGVKICRRADVEWYVGDGVPVEYQHLIRKIDFERKCPTLDSYMGAARSAKKRATRLKRTPAWANIDKIREFYKRAEQLTKDIGLQHHVDHIVPLKGATVSGLHVEDNLQIITKYENLSKKNRWRGT